MYGRDPSKPAELTEEEKEAKAVKDAENKRELEAAKAEEARQHAERQAEIAASWTKRVTTKGTGPKAYHGAQAKVHIVGRATIDKRIGSARAEETGFKSGSVFEDSRERGVPVMLLLGRGILVPALDECLMTMHKGERAEVIIKPEGGYGAAGSVDHPCVPGSATLTYDVELLDVEKEEELWELSFEAKMTLAEERRQRGNVLIKGKHYLMADAEYEQALRYLIFMPHPELHQVLPIAEKLNAVHLNLAAVKLRMDREEAAIKHCQDALKAQPEGNTKAHYRMGQAYIQLGKYAKARDQLTKAEATAGKDEATKKAIAAELERLGRRQERHARDRKKAGARMMHGAGGDEHRSTMLTRMLARVKSTCADSFFPKASDGVHRFDPFAAFGAFAVLAAIMSCGAMATWGLASITSGGEITTSG